MERRFSSWTKAVRVAAYVLRFIDKIKKAPMISSSKQRSAERNSVQRIRHRTHFTLFGYLEVKRSYQYQPFVDDDGLIRCRSRLEKSNEFFYSEKYPIILPGNNSLVERFVHWVDAVKCLHSGGLNTLLQQLRSSFLMTQDRRGVQGVLANCKA